MALSLTRAEQRIAIGLGVIGVAVFAALRVHVVWTTIGVLLALILVINGLRRRRVPAAIAAFFCGLGPWWDGFIIFGVAYVVFGFLLARAGRQEA